MKIKNKYEFKTIVEDILNDKNFIELKSELHHGISRYDHSIRVAKCTYSLTKKLNLDYERATRAALLHDFFTSDDVKELSNSEAFYNHPNIALENAKKYFDLDVKQENIIASHMYPACNTKPKYFESWITNVADKMVATYEMYRFKLSLVMGVWILFIVNIINIQK